MRRVVSVWFPTLPTDRLQQLEGNGSAINEIKEGLASIAGCEGRAPVLPQITTTNRMVVSMDANATALGLRSGMTVAQAQALVPDLVVREADPAEDAALLLRLAQWCLRYTPLAGIDPPDGLWIDVTGCTHLYGGEARLLRDLVARLAARGLGARVAVADTPAVAHAAARFSGGGVVPGAAMIDEFPVEALRLPSDVVVDLRLLGFECVGAIAQASRAPLIRRFGAVLAQRLDQAAGVLFEPIVPVTPLTSIQARRNFVEPLLTAEAFMAVITVLVAEVCVALERVVLGARRLDLRFERVDGSLQAVRIGTARAGHDPRHLARMLKERLEHVDPGLGIEAMHLIVIDTDPLRFVQMASSLVAEHSVDLAHLVDRLVNRLGEGRVYQVAPVESDVPERCVRLAPALTQLNEGWPGDLPRPVRLLEPPQPVEAMALLPDHPPVVFTWRRVRHRVRHTDGPERIAGEWWKRDREWFAVRDYFRVEDESGRRFWMFRRGNGSDTETGDMLWFLHGFL